MTRLKPAPIACSTHASFGHSLNMKPDRHVGLQGRRLAQRGVQTAAPGPRRPAVPASHSPLNPMMMGERVASAASITPCTDSRLQLSKYPTRVVMVTGVLHQAIDRFERHWKTLTLAEAAEKQRW